MSSNPWLWSAAVALPASIGLQGLLSSLETTLLSARRSRLRELAPEGSARLQRAEEILDSPCPFEVAAHITSTCCEAVSYASAAVLGLELAARMNPAHQPAGGRLDLPIGAAPWLVLTLLLAALSVLLLAEALPKAIATRSPEDTLLRWAGFIRVFALAMAPAVALVRSVGGGMARLLRIRADPAGPAARTEEEIKILVGSSADAGVIEEEEKEMIHSIFDFTETVARQVMVPRIQIHGVEADAPLREAAHIILQEGHSRLPVYQGTLDEIIGIVYAKDLIRELLDGRRETPVRSLAREPYFVPETKKLDALLHEFRNQRTQLAIVVDEFGGTAGLVTIEDVLEEIVGEIQDEYDAEEPDVSEVEPGVFVVDAGMSVDDANEVLGLDLASGDYETVGGLVYSLLGRPPEVGEELEHHGARFVVEATDGTRLLKIRVSPPPSPAPEDVSSHPTGSTA